MTFIPTYARLVTITAVLLAAGSCSEPAGPLTPGEPASISAVAGHGQTLTSGDKAVPPSALVTDANGTPVPGVAVAFSLVYSYGGSVSIGTVTTGIDGIARLEGWTPPPGADSYGVQARTGNLYCTFGVKIVAGEAAKISFLDVPLAYRIQAASAEIPAGAQVTDSAGNWIAGVAVTFSAGSSGGTVSNAVLRTDQYGIVRPALFKLGASLGSYTLVAKAGKARDSIAIVAVSGPPALIVPVAGEGEVVTAGGNVRLNVRVTDADGRPAPNVLVKWSPDAGSSTFLADSRTNDLGIGWNGWRLIVPGSRTITANIGAPTASITATALPLPTAFSFVSAPDTLNEVRTDTELPSELVVQVRLADGSPGVGYPLTFEQYSGSVSTTKAVTDSTGRASTRWRTAASPGRNVITASLDGVIRTSTSVRTFGPPTFFAVFAGRSHTCGSGEPGILCWGSNTLQQAGGPKGGPPHLVPSVVAAGLQRDLRYWALGDHSCKFDSQFYGRSGTKETTACWGLGPAGVETFGSPTLVPNTAYQLPGFEGANLGATALSRTDGALHACVVAGLPTQGGTLHCLGRNDHGQLGDGTTQDRTAPVAALGGITFAAGGLALGESHTCGVSVTSAAYCWGRNDAGQLGDGSVADRTSPVLVAGGITFARVQAGVAHTCALTASGTAYCWGSNADGQLGTGSFGSNATTPQRVAGGHAFRSITVGDHHACGWLANGLTHCWGRNSSGQLGDGTTANRSAPVPVTDYHPPR